MSGNLGQLGLFDNAPHSDPKPETLARTRMRAMISRLQEATVPPWPDHMGAILDDGAFQRAMRMVPAAEAQALWEEFDPLMERLYAVLVESMPVQAE